MLKSIPINPKYLISDDGLTVINEVTGNRLKIGDQRGNGNPTGYKYVSLIFDVGEYVIKRMSVHRLMALTYLPTPDPSKVWVNHKDGDKGNNHIDNLEWTTISENIQHAWDTGLKTSPRGKDHWKYGVKHSIEARQKQSIAKQGEKHPKFKGWYVVIFRKYDSLRAAQAETLIPKKTIYNRCMKGDKSSGFYFIPKESTTN